MRTSVLYALTLWVLLIGWSVRGQAAADTVTTSASASAPAAESGASLKARLASLEKTGEAELTWLWFKLYRAELLVSAAPYQVAQWPQALRISYLRDIEKKHLLTATDEQWQHLGLEASKRTAWLARLDALWPDIQSGDQITFWVGDEQRNQFYHNDNALGAVDDPEFAKQFLAIWLDENSDYPEQRLELIGATP